MKLLLGLRPLRAGLRADCVAKLATAVREAASRGFPVLHVEEREEERRDDDVGPAVEQVEAAQQPQREPADARPERAAMAGDAEAQLDFVDVSAILLHPFLTDQALSKEIPTCCVEEVPRNRCMNICRHCRKI